MRIALVSDVHGNLPALEAALEAIDKRHPDRILSLGDQVNLGPCSQEVVALLRSRNVTMLSGNHERYIRCAMANDPAYAGANFESLRFNAKRLSPDDLNCPDSIEIEGILFCHALPGNDYFPVFDPARALPGLLARYTEGFTHIICGHGHNPTHYQLPHLRLDSIDSTGSMDEGAPGMAPFAMLEITDDAMVLKRFAAIYNYTSLPHLFVSTGLADFCPIMSRVSCMQAMRNQSVLMPFVRQAMALSHEREEEHMSLATWQEADARFPWPDGLSTAAFWRQATRN